MDVADDAAPVDERPGVATGVGVLPSLKRKKKINKYVSYLLIINEYLK